MPYILRRKDLGRSSCNGIEMFSTKGIKTTLDGMEVPNGEVIFRWGCTKTLPDSTKKINHASSIHLVNNKAEFRKILQAHKLCPETIFGFEEERHIYFPVIVRPPHHSQGKHFYVVDNYLDYLDIICMCGPQCYTTKIIKKIAEYRIYVVQGRVVCVASKTPGKVDDVAWNVARGGHFKNVLWGDWPLSACEIAIKSMALAELTFGGVDVIIDPEEKPLVLEINSACSLTSKYRQQCFAKAFDWIISKGEMDIPISPGNSWKKYIHPSISAEAI